MTDPIDPAGQELPLQDPQPADESAEAASPPETQSPGISSQPETPSPPEMQLPETPAQPEEQAPETPSQPEVPSQPEAQSPETPDQPEVSGQGQPETQSPEAAGQAPAVDQASDSPAPAVDKNNAAPQQQNRRQQAEPTGPSLVVRYGLMRHIGEFRHNLKITPLPSSKVVVRTERGVELGTVVRPVTRQDSAAGPNTMTAETLNKFLDSNGPDYPFRRGGRVLRAANHQDIVDFQHLQTSAVEAGKYCQQKIREKKLPMRLVTTEHMLGGGRIVFYFNAESRVDFRELVRDLASQFRTRIEMRQVGARDEARLVADYERCGQRCCCQQYLKDLKPVSMRMAKVQKATLDPSKISGRCGRLMCCLRYEDVCYEELRKNLPRRNTWLRTEDCIGKVIDSQIITQLVRLWLPNNTQVVVSIEDIIERDLPEPEAGSQPGRKPRPETRRRAATEKPPTDADADTRDLPKESEGSSQENQGGDSRRKRRPRRGKKPNRGGQSQGQSQPQRDGQDNSQKRRRRRRKKPGQSQGGNPPAGNPPAGNPPAGNA